MQRKSSIKLKIILYGIYVFCEIISRIGSLKPPMKQWDEYWVRYVCTID